MGSGYRHTWRALWASLAVALAPHTALGDLSAVEPYELRRVLSQVEKEVTSGLSGPVSVSDIWSRLQLDGVSPAASAVVPATGAQFLNSTSPAPKFGAVAPSGALFSAVPKAVTVGTVSKGFGHIAQHAPLGRAAPLDSGSTNFRIILASLAQTYTGENNQAVVNAQGTRGPVALSIRAGDVTLADLQALSAAQGSPPRPDGALTLPVVIWPDATLRLAPGERMALARDAGAFVLSMGAMEIDGATVEVSGPENPHTPSFTPFVTVVSGGSLLIQDATLRGLGFGQTAKFSGLSVAGNLLTHDKGSVVIRDSLFEGLNVVSIAGVSGAVVSGNTFLNSRDNALNLANAPRSSVEGNIFAGTSPTNAIRLDQGSAYARVDRNLFLSGDRVAVLINGASDHVQVRDNVIWQRAGAGVKFLRSSCGLAEGNVILDNRQKGVEVRKSDGTVVRDNLIVGNRSAGVWVSAQARDAQTSITGNIFAANGAGLSAATGAEILMQGNNFAKQLPRLLDGDISRLTNSVVVDLRGAVPLRIKNGRADQNLTGPVLCGSDL